MDKLEKYEEYAKKIKLFNGLSAEDVGAILKQGEVLDFHQGKTIFFEGQLGSNIFVVFKGEVGIHIHNDLIAKCKVGDAFGEMSVLNHRPHSGTASAVTDVRCFVIREEQLNKILEMRVAVRFLLNVIHILSGHLEIANHKVSEMKRQLKRAGITPEHLPQHRPAT